MFWEYILLYTLHGAYGVFHRPWVVCVASSQSRCSWMWGPAYPEYAASLNVNSPSHVIEEKSDTTLHD